MKEGKKSPTFPKRIRVLDTWYKVNIRPDPEGDDDFGIVNLRTATITINDLPPVTYQLRTLFHEIIHIEQSCRCAELDEEEATRLSQLINQLLLDNPDLVAFYHNLHVAGK